MNRGSDCKGCSSSVRIGDEEIEEAIRKLSMVKTTKFVGDEKYQIRLAQCGACEYLEYDTTCLQCGCIVQIRAKLEDGKCPYPKKAKW